MLGIDRRTLQAAWTLFLFALVLLVIYRIRRTLLIFAIAVIFAHLLAPVVDFIQRRFPARVPRIAALGLVYIALIGILVGAFIPIGNQLSQESATLTAKLPDALKTDPLERFPIPRWLEPIRPQVTEFLHDRLSELGQTIGPMLTEASRRLITGIGSLL